MAEHWLYARPPEDPEPEFALPDTMGDGVGVGVASTSASLTLAIVPASGVVTGRAPLPTFEARFVGLSLMAAESVAEFRAAQVTDGSVQATICTFD